MTISVVVIGRNEGARLRRCLESIGRSERAALEVIYVDSNSSDGSPQLAESFGARALRVIADRPTAALGRNVGWRAALGSHILFLDGDTVLDAGFLGQAEAAFADHSVAIVWGHRREIATVDSVYNRVLDLDWIYAPGDAAFCGGDALFRRDVLVDTGGFDESLIAGEEPELCRRITVRGLRIVHIDQPMTGHDLAMKSFRPYWRRATRAGHAFAEVSARFRNTEQPFWLEDSRRNLVRASLLLMLCLGSLAASVLLGRAWPLLLVGGLLLLLVLRTAYKARWKSEDRTALLLYGIHSHFQQIPIFVGQMQYRLNRVRGKRAGLVEYKES